MKFIYEAIPVFLHPFLKTFLPEPGYVPIQTKYNKMPRKQYMVKLLGSLETGAIHKHFPSYYSPSNLMLGRVRGTH